MLTVLPLTATTQLEWDAIIRSFPNHDFYYLSHYLNLTKPANAQPVLFYYDDATFSAVHVAHQTDLINLAGFNTKVAPRQYYQLTSGAGYGGFLFRGQPSLRQLAQLEHSYQSACEVRHIICEQVRFHPTQFHQTSNQFMYQIKESTPAIALDLTNQTTLDSVAQPIIHKTVQAALNSGVEFEVAQTGEALEKLYQLSTDTVVNGPLKCSRNYLGKINLAFPQQYQVLLARYHGTTIAGGLVISLNHQLTGQFFGHRQHLLGQSAETLLYYAAAEWGREQGDQVFFLGGGSAEQVRQQTELNATGHPAAILSTGQKIFDQARFDQLTQMAPISSLFNNYSVTINSAV